MEIGEDITSRDASSHSRQTLDVLILSSLGVGLGMRFHRIFQAQTLKHLSVAIKVAEGALKGTRALQELHSPSPESLIFASKTLIKGYKASRRLKLFRTGSHGNPSVIIKRLKAYMGLVSLVRYAESSVSGNGFIGFGLLTNGYKISKNFLKVLEGFVGLQLDSAIRNGFEALGSLVRAAFVAREVKRIAIEWRKRSSCYCRFVRTVDMRYGVRLALKSTDIVYNNFGYATIPVKYIPLSERVLINEDHISELLCLSIPICEEILYTAL